MDPARWERMQEVFHAALDLPAAQQPAFLQETCGEDEHLRAGVLAMLEEDARRTSSLLDRGVGHLAQQVLGEPAPDAPLPTTFGRYAITRKLGEGGMGVVYLARREDLDRLVAIKILRDAWVSPARRDRFAAEQRTLAQLTHPSIARLYDADTLADGTPWFAMEYVEGVSLTEYCNSRAPSIADRLRLFRDVCEAVGHAHRHLIVHRDLKPANILVTSDGHVKLLDFGISKQLDDLTPSTEQTGTVVRLMTPAYASPEQVRGERAGIQTDIYSLGVILYELLSGRCPYDLSELTPAETATAILQQQPERPSRAGAAATAAALSASRTAWADLDVLCLTAMHKEPQRRYPSIEALVRDIDHYESGEPLEARTDSLRYRTGKFVGRHWRGLSAASIVLVFIIGLVAFYTVRLTTARNAALAEAARTQRIQRFMLNLFEGDDQTTAPPEALRVVTLVERGVQQAHGLAAEPAVQAELYQTLGSLYQKLGDYDRADTLLQSALDQRRRLRGAEHPDVAESLVGLGLLRIDQSRLDEAERLAREGLEMSRRTLPADHPGVALATAVLGKTLEERGAYAEAIPLLEDAARLYAVSGPSTPELAETLGELANTHFYAGQLDESNALNRRVLAIERQLHGDRHPNVADSLINLGAIESSRGKYAESERFSREALQIFQAWYGDDHPETASAKTIVAQSLVYQEKYGEAATLLRQALATQERVHGVVHQRVAFALNELGSVALRRGELAEAQEAYSRSLDIYQTIYGRGHYRSGVAMSNLAGVHLAREEYPAAERLFREAIEVFSRAQSPDHLNTGIARVKLGRVLVRQRRHEEAEAHLTAGYAIVSRQSSPSVSWLRTAREDLALVYDALDKPDAAQKFRDELATGREASPRRPSPRRRRRDHVRS